MKENLTITLNNNDIVFEKFDKEIVAINLKTGIYYSISGAGFFIWGLIEDNFKIESVKEFYKKKYKEEKNIDNDIDDFVKELILEKLAVSVSNGHSESNEIVKNLTLTEVKYEKPELEKYTDQQELLLLDPIHEVNEFGWPEKK
ncbi:MAG: PqqD family peptide modification chaperone [Acidobacteriota bacterium]